MGETAATVLEGPPATGLKLHAIDDGLFGLDGGAMFGIVPRPLWSKVHVPDEQNRIDMATRCLVIEDGARLVLIDTGIGDQWSEREVGLYAMRRAPGALFTALAARGYGPDDVTDVIQTHLHFDHAGQACRAVDGPPGEPVRFAPSFPKATYHIQREQWLWAHGPSSRDAGSYRRDNFAALAALEATGRLHLLDGDGPILKSASTTFSATVVNGHTPGLQVVTFGHQGATFAFVSDLIPTAAHCHLPWIMGYDLCALTTAREKEALLPKMAEGRWVVVFQHDPGVEAGQVSKNAKGQFAIGQPLAVASL